MKLKRTKAKRLSGHPISFQPLRILFSPLLSLFCSLCYLVLPLLFMRVCLKICVFCAWLSCGNIIVWSLGDSLDMKKPCRGAILRKLDLIRSSFFRSCEQNGEKYNDWALNPLPSFAIFRPFCFLTSIGVEFSFLVKCAVHFWFLYLG